MCFFFKQKTAYVMRIGDWSSDLCSSDLLGRKFGTVVSANTHLTDRLTAGGVAGVVTLPMGVDPGIFAQEHRDRHLRRELLARCAPPDSASLLRPEERRVGNKCVGTSRWRRLAFDYKNTTNKTPTV